jgi:uncharacterized protein (DUF2147 family)
MPRSALLATTFALFAAFPLGTFAQADITGHWKTIDDKTSEPRSIIQIEQRGSEYVGVVRDILSGADDKRCEKCEGDLKDQPIVGLQILSELKQQDGKYEGGRILDPESGKVYRATLWLEDDDTLKVRGYLGPFFRTQTWQRTEP